MCFDCRIRVDGVPGGFLGDGMYTWCFFWNGIGDGVSVTCDGHMEHLEVVMVELIISSQKSEELRL